MRKVALLVSAAVMASLAVSVPAYADIIEVNASAIQGDNVLFNDGVQTGTEVFGHTQAGTDVRFTGTTTNGNVIRANGGQARIEGALNTGTANPNDTFSLTSLTWALVGGNTFNNLEFNLFNPTDTDATVDFFVTNNFGVTEEFLNRSLSGSGSNFFGFQGVGGQSIAQFRFVVDGGEAVLDTRQIRLDEVTSTPAIPEPATWGMMLIGFGAVGGMMRRKRQHAKSVRVRYA
jgi:hypothetical protein